MTSPIDTASVAIVPDFSGFAREARAGIDAALRQLVGQIDRAFSGVERAAADAGGDIGREFQDGGESAERALRELSATATTSMNNVSRQTDQAAAGISTKLGGALDLLKGGLLAGGAAAAAGLGALTVFGLKSAASLEQVQVAFNSLLGSVGAGTKAFTELQHFAAVTPFEFTDVAGAAQRFFAFAGSVGLSKDRVQQFLTTLGDVASVTGGGAQALNSVTLAMGQIASSGKVTLDNLNQISEALPGFSGVAAIASATGKTTAQVMDEISSGSINATVGIQALLKGMQTFPGAAGAMEAQSQTLLGVFSTFKDTLSQALVGGFAPVIPAIKDSLGQLTPILGDALGQLAPSLGKLLSGLLPLIGNLVQAIVPILTPLLDALGPGLQALGPALIPLGAALGQILVALAPILPLLGEFLAVVIQVAVPVLQLLALVLKPLTPIINFMSAAIAELGKALGLIDWRAVGNAIGGAFLDAIRAVGGFFVGIGEWFAKLPGLITAGLSALPGLLVAGANRAFDLFFTAVGFGIGLIIRAFIELPVRINALIGLLWITVVDLTRAGIARVVQFFNDLPVTVATLVALLWVRVQTFFTTGITNVVALVQSLPPRIFAALTGLRDRLFDTGKNMILGLIDGIKATVGRAIDTVKRAMADIVNGAKKALGIASPSTVFAAAVGAQIPAGIEQGIQAGLPSLQSLLNNVTQPVVAGGASGGTPAGATTGPISITIHFAGVVPSEAEARRTGQAAGAGVADAISRRNVALAARQV